MKTKTGILLYSLLIFLLIGAFSPIMAGQTWLTWNERSGLPSSNITCLAIQKGMMVVGSDKGIGIFCEGYPAWFRLADYHEMLQELPVRSMDFDSHGSLWATTPQGVLAVNLNGFPEKAPEVRFFDTQYGLPTIDVEALQIHQGKLYVSCFGGWLASAEIQPGSNISSFKLENDGRLEREDSNKILSVGVTAMAMDFPGGGIYATKGSGILKVGSSESAVFDALPSDWVDDFWSFNDGHHYRIIAVTQDKINLITDQRLVGECVLPAAACWITCLTTVSAEPEDGYKKPRLPGYLKLETFLGKHRSLYLGTKGKGLWIFADGRWSNYTSRDSALPSDNINKIYYLPGAKKVAILSDAGLTMLGISEEMNFDAFETSGSAPFYASTIWPFMSRWGPYVFGYPYQHSYPVENSINYGRTIVKKDLWIAHEKGISRYVFPSSPFIGAMQDQYHLCGRFENDLNNAASNLNKEDSSTSGDQPVALEGENIWHHYCMEAPADVCGAPLDDIWVTLDLKFMVGPLDQIATFTAESEQQIKGINFSKASGTPIIIQGDKRFNKNGEQLYTVASLYQDCNLHQIPAAEVTDMTLDLSERPFVIFAGNRLACLDAPVSEVVPDTKQYWWHEFATNQLPWEEFDELYLISMIGADLYVGGKKSGLFFLPAAHTFAAADIKAENWQRITVPDADNTTESFCKIIGVARWNNCDGETIALLHSEGLSLFDGTSLQKVAVPVRSYTSIIADRQNNLWLGSKNGLFHLTPQKELCEVIDGEFNTKYVYYMAAAPDNSRYPFTIAVVVDGRAHLLKHSDPLPLLSYGTDSLHRLRVVNTQVFGGAQILLFDGKKWEALARPGVNAITFDQSYLWVSTTCRVLRLFMPVLAQTY